MPDVDGGVGNRLAGTRFQNQNAQRERDARLSFGDLRAQHFIGDVERAGFLLGRGDAGILRLRGRVRKAERASDAIRCQGGCGCEACAEKPAAREVRDAVALLRSAYRIDASAPGVLA